MTYYGGKNIADSFRTVRKNTLAIAEEIPEEKYGFRAAPEVMSVAELLAHLAVSPGWQLEVHGQKVGRIEFAMFSDRMQRAAAAEKALRTKAEIVAALREEGEKFASFVEPLDEAALSSTVSFPPPVQPATKTRLRPAREPAGLHRVVDLRDGDFFQRGTPRSAEARSGEAGPAPTGAAAAPSA